MPKNKEKLDTSPSSPFLTKKLGRRPEKGYDEVLPQQRGTPLEVAAAGANIGMGTNANIRPMNRLEQFLFGHGYGMTYPNNTVIMNMPDATRDDMVTDTLAHELTHTKQPMRSPLQAIKDRFTPWDKIPSEQEAIAAERNIPWKPKGRDTYLPIDTAPIAAYTKMINDRKKRK